MIKRFCDRCGEEIVVKDNGRTLWQKVTDAMKELTYSLNGDADYQVVHCDEYLELCHECKAALRQFMEGGKHENEKI